MSRCYHGMSGPATIAGPRHSAAGTGAWALRKEGTWRNAQANRSLVSFKGWMLTAEFGARRADSMATAYGCAGTSSGSTSMGVWQARTKSRVTVKTKSGSVRYILVRNASTIAIVISGRRAHSGGPH